LRSGLERCTQKNGDLVERVERAAQFTQITDKERDGIIVQVRQLLHEGMAPSKVLREIAQQTDRHIDTIRYTVRVYDKKNPETTVFPERTAQELEEAKQRKIYEEYLQGYSLPLLVRRHERDYQDIKSIINKYRIKKIMNTDLDHIYCREFGLRNTTVLDPMPEPEGTLRKTRAPGGLPAYLATLYDIPLLTPNQERHLFRKYNFCKYMAAKMRERLASEEIGSKKDVSAIEPLIAEAEATKELLVQSNLRVPVSRAKRSSKPEDVDFFELVSEGNMALMRAVDKFDYSRGNKFITYATWAIDKRFASSVPAERKQLKRYCTGADDTTLSDGTSLLEALIPDRSDQYGQEIVQNTRQRGLSKALSHLDEREQKIIAARFGLGRGREPQTLKQVGEEMGIGIDSTRQQLAHALSNLRTIVLDCSPELEDVA